MSIDLNSSGVQLNMNFDPPGENIFKKHLDNAIFSIAFEIRVPSADADLAGAVARFAEMERVAAEEKRIPCSLAFTDIGTPDPYNICGFASALCRTGRGAHVIYVSGRGRSPQDTAGILAECRQEGFMSVCAVSGTELKKDPSRKPFTESVNILDINRSSRTPLFAGCTVNPFKYNIEGTLAQYFKLTKKVSAGASFAVAQCGWDMLKLQELKWHLYRRNITIPLLARLMFLTSERAEDICSGKIPGICVSNDFKNGIRREMMHSNAQFQAAQWRRLQIHAAGARLLGYSGIQISGIETPEHMRIAIARIAESFTEFPDMESWLAAHKEYYSRMDMLPYPARFYMFESLLEKNADCENARLRDEQVPPPSASEKFRRNAAEFFFKGCDKAPPSARGLTKRLIVSCRGCTKCRLPFCGYVCPETCPRSFAAGACGEASESNVCPVNGRECVHAGRIRMAVALDDFSDVEEIIPPPEDA